MQAWDMIWFRWLFIMTLSGFGLVIACYLGFYLPNLPGRPPEKHHPVRKEWPAGIQETPAGIPSLLWFIMIGLVVFFIAYFVWVWQSRQPV